MLALAHKTPGCCQATKCTWASLLAESEGYLRILQEKIFERWYLEDCKILPHVNCNANKKLATATLKRMGLQLVV